jgi:hypothetical protein
MKTAYTVRPLGAYQYQVIDPEGCEFGRPMPHGQAQDLAYMLTDARLRRLEESLREAMGS